MKYFLKSILKYYLKYLSIFALRWHKPLVIAVSGSINQCFTKNAIKKMLKAANFEARTDLKNFNTEIGLPLAVLGLKSGYNSYKEWLSTILEAPFAIFKKDFPKILVLSLGSSDPGDLKYLLTIVNPEIAVITGITQKHMEGFGCSEDLFKEYSYLSARLSNNALLVLNRDITGFEVIKDSTKAKLATFGFHEDSEFRASQVINDTFGQKFILDTSASSKEIRISKHGQHHVYAFLAALIISEYVQRHFKTNGKAPRKG